MATRAALGTQETWNHIVTRQPYLRTGAGVLLQLQIPVTTTGRAT